MLSLAQLSRSLFFILDSTTNIAKLSQAPAPTGLSLALFPNYPATRPGRPNPTGIVFFSATFQPELNAI